MLWKITIDVENNNNISNKQRGAYCELKSGVVTGHTEGYKL